MDRPCENHANELKNLICMECDKLICHKCKDEKEAEHKDKVVGLLAYHNM